VLWLVTLVQSCRVSPRMGSVATPDYSIVMICCPTARHFFFAMQGQSVGQSTSH
jgi:hypothetical protein